MEREPEIEKKLKDEIKALGGLCWKFVSPGTRGVPDRIIVLPGGKIIFAELKAKTGVEANIQKYRIKQLNDRGLDARIIRGSADAKALVEECTMWVGEVNPSGI